MPERPTPHTHQQKISHALGDRYSYGRSRTCVDPHCDRQLGFWQPRSCAANLRSTGNHKHPLGPHGKGPVTAPGPRRIAWHDWGTPGLCVNAGRGAEFEARATRKN
jgi:hypothetical protein